MNTSVQNKDINFVYPSLVVSNFFINKSIEEGTELTPMKLLKLVYITHGWFLGYNGRPLIKEAVEAWKYGPVIDVVYQAIKHFGSGQVTSFIDVYKDGVINPNEYMLDEGTDKFCTVIWDHYKTKDGIQLSALTHKPGTPWDKTINNPGSIKVIPNKLIEDYYKNMINESIQA